MGSQGMAGMYPRDGEGEGVVFMWMSDPERILMSAFGWVSGE
jgi:hypothetical protein